LAVHSFQLYGIVCFGTMVSKTVLNLLLFSDNLEMVFSFLIKLSICLNRHVQKSTLCYLLQFFWIKCEIIGESNNKTSYPFAYFDIRVLCIFITSI
jgi:hypothetical protein